MYVRKTRNLSEIERLDTEIFGEEKESSKKLKANIWWLAYVDGEVAGYAGLKVFSETKGVSSGFLCKAGVLPKFRGLGIQKALIKVRDREARRLGLNMNITYAAYDNPASVNNLIKCGYMYYNPDYKYGLKDGIYLRKIFKY